MTLQSAVHKATDKLKNLPPAPEMLTTTMAGN